MNPTPSGETKRLLALGARLRRRLEDMESRLAPGELPDMMFLTVWRECINTARMAVTAKASHIAASKIENELRRAAKERADAMSIAEAKAELRAEEARNMSEQEWNARMGSQ